MAVFQHNIEDGEFNAYFEVLSKKWKAIKLLASPEKFRLDKGSNYSRLQLDCSKPGQRVNC